MQDLTKNQTFIYNIDAPLTNGSFANRIAVENFEYESNTNLSLTERYENENFSLIIEDFNDIDFKNTNNTYFSKCCEITKVKSFQLEYEFIYNLTDRDLRQSYTQAKIIQKIIDSNYLRFDFAYDSSYLQFFFNYATRELYIYNGSYVYRKINFMPSSNYYEYIYLSFNPVLVYSDYVVNIDMIAYNQTGKITLQNSTQLNLQYFKTKILTQFSIDVGIEHVLDTTQMIAIDMNFITDRRLYSQNSILNDEYGANDIKTFYLTSVPFYSSLFTSNSMNYATTIYRNRYLRYKTNSSIQLVGGANLKSTLAKSFDIKLEMALNNTSILHGISFNFDNWTIRIEINDSSSFKIDIKYYHGANLLRTNRYNFYSFFDNNVIFRGQFKNNQFLLAFTHNFSVVSEDFFIDTDFSGMDFLGEFTNFQYTSLNITSITSFSNNSFNVISDFLTFKDRISAIESYFTFTNIIVIPSNSITSISIDGREYNIRTAIILNIQIDCLRSSSNGGFELTSDNEIFYSCFSNDDELNNSFDSTLLYGKNGGNIYLFAVFYQSSSSEIRLDLTLHFTRYLIFTDQIPANNLWIAKSIEILIPLSIFFLIVLGFKSESNSKYLAIIGMYIAIFVFYLLEYMSLIFMILSFIFLTIGLYIIIKQEKGSEI